jgi:hypothetical protein
MDETVLLMYRSGAWRLADNISYIEPIYFSGTNAAANAAASRTNLGLGASWLTNTNVTNFRTEIGLGAADSINAYEFRADFTGSDFVVLQGSGVQFAGVSAANTRTNLGLGLAALTNNNVTNFRTAIGLGETNNVEFNNLKISKIDGKTEESYVQFDDDFLKLNADSEVIVEAQLVVSNSSFFGTNITVNGFVDFSTNRTNSNPATNNQINDFIEIRVGTNQFWLPVYK